MSALGWLGAVVGVGLALFGLAACDQRRIDALEEGVHTEADVRKQFGEPAAVYDEPDGSRTLEYPRQPEGQVNYMIRIGTDGKMSALRQVLTPANFAALRPGMDKAEVRRALGRPASAQFFELKQQEVWEWRYLDAQEARVFHVTFDRDGRLVTTGSQWDQRGMTG